MESERRCHGHGFQKENYNVVIGPKPWPWFLRLRTYTSICCRLFQFFFNLCLCLVACCWIYIIIVLVPVLNFNGSRAPRTELEGLTIHDFNLTRDDTTVPTAPWVVNGNFTVVFQARNPSWVVGFRHRYLSTRVSAFYNSTLLGKSEVPRFSQGYKSARHVSANVVVREQRMNQTVGSQVQSEMQEWGSVRLRIAVDANVGVKRFRWQDPKWFNLTCWVDASMPNSSNGHWVTNLLSKTCT